MITKFYIFTVKGRGKFPVDMLRFDSCYPANSIHNDNILNIDVCQHEKEYYMERKVVLTKPISSKKETPTKDRWKLFGWEVTKMMYVQY